MDNKQPKIEVSTGGSVGGIIIKEPHMHGPGEYKLIVEVKLDKNLEDLFKLFFQKSFKDKFKEMIGI